MEADDEEESEEAGDTMVKAATDSDPDQSL